MPEICESDGWITEVWEDLDECVEFEYCENIARGDEFEISLIWLKILCLNNLSCESLNSSSSGRRLIKNILRASCLSMLWELAVISILAFLALKYSATVLSLSAADLFLSARLSSTRVDEDCAGVSAICSDNTVMLDDAGCVDASSIYTLFSLFFTSFWSI